MRKILISFIMVAVFTLAGCANIFQRIVDNYEQGNEDEENCELIYQAFVEKDASLIIDKFCKRLSNNNLESKLNGAFDYIDGKIVSYEKMDCTSNEGSSVRDGVTVERHVYHEIYNIATDTGNHYLISVFNQSIYTENTDLEGFQKLQVIQLDSNGDYITGDDGEHIKYCVGDFLT